MTILNHVSCIYESASLELRWPGVYWPAWMVAPETGWHYGWPAFPHCWHLTAIPWDDTHRGFVFFSLNCMVLDLSCLFILTCKCWHSTTACDGWELIKCAWYMVPNCSENLAYWVLPFWYINFTVQKFTFLNNLFYYLTTRATNLVCHIWLSSCRPYIHVNENVTINIFFRRHFTLILKGKMSVHHRKLEKYKKS